MSYPTIAGDMSEDRLSSFGSFQVEGSGRSTQTLLRRPVSKTAAHPSPQLASAYANRPDYCLGVRIQAPLKPRRSCT